MGFLSPWLLSGLALLGVPLWLHLLRKHKSTPMPFSSLMFFERHTQSSIKQRRLDHLLLLAVRLLLLALLVAAFAKPFLMRDAAALDQNRMQLIVLDESASMGHADRMQKAQAKAQELLGKVREGAEWQVASFADKFRLHTQPGADAAALRAAAATVTVGSARSSYGEMARAVRALAEGRKSPVHVHLITDLQRTSMPGGFSELDLGAKTTLTVHPVVSTEQPNWTVESVTAPRRLGDHKKARVRVTLASFAPASAERRVVLSTGGKDIATKTAQIPARGRAQVEFLGLDLPYGLNRCQIRIEPADSLPADDAFLFAVERSDPLKVLFVYGPRAGRSTLYFESALESAAENAYSLVSVPSGQLAGQSPEKYSFVVLSDPGDLGQDAESALRRYIDSGGSVWIALGPGSSTRSRVPISGEPIAESKYASRTADRFQSVDTADETHPSLAGTERWANVRFYQYALIRPDKSRVVARLNDQSPVLLEQSIGEGRLLVFASALDNVSNDFPLHAAFVPFVEHSSSYLAGRNDRSANYAVGSFLELRQAQGRGAAVEVLDPQGKRALGLAASAQAQVVELEQSGFYQVRRGAGRDELIAVNVDRRESDLSLIPQDALNLWQGLEDQPSPAVPAGQPARETVPWILAWILLCGVLVACLVEALIASQTTRTEGV